MGSQLIKKQFAVTRKNILSLLEGVSPEVLDVVPEGFNNNIHWQIGHILTAGELFLFNGQKNLPENYGQHFAGGTKPADWTNDVPSVEDILVKLQEQLERINQISDDSFEIELEKPFIGNKTVGELAAFGAFHESLHLGQIQILKRLIESQK
ncbi:DinB family protein [Lysinibacillus endophyticus]|uniref:DinB family protein n=1 Tax=Ureibacillus endophyticus TaxID=1978490 RepID=UPI00209E43AC|nr:DinB family protein [Lysinibacillus endophyticus]MCP1145051.1 DinB family protein [Lysinibacillus endophyticus]